jgi:hypothetical protein
MALQQAAVVHLGLVLRRISPCLQALRMPRIRLDSSQLRCEDSY